MDIFPAEVVASVISKLRCSSNSQIRLCSSKVNFNNRQSQVQMSQYQLRKQFEYLKAAMISN